MLVVTMCSKGRVSKVAVWLSDDHLCQMTSLGDQTSRFQTRCKPPHSFMPVGMRLVVAHDHFGNDMGKLS